MKNITRFVGELLGTTTRESQAYERAMRVYLARQPKNLQKRGTRYPSRGELHDRPPPPARSPANS